MSFTITNALNTDGVSAVPGKDNRANGIELYSGMMLTAFDEKNIGRGLVTTKHISKGISYQFMVAGSFVDTDVKVHTPGEDLDTTVLKYDKIQIKVDDKLYISSLVDDLDEKLSHFDERASLAKERSSVMSIKMDKRIFSEFATAITTTPKPGQKAASVVVKTEIATAATESEKGDAILEGIFALKSELRKKDVTEELTFVMDEDNYYRLNLSQKGVNRDYTNSNGGVDSGEVLMIAGVKIVTTNHLPTTIENTVGYMTTPATIGLVIAMDLKSESNFVAMKDSYLLTDKMAYGIGVLNPTTIGILKSGI